MQQVDGVELRIVVVEFFPDLPSSRKAEYSCFIFGYKDGDVGSQYLLLPTLSTYFFIQRGQKNVGDDTGVRRLPALDVYVCDGGCVFDVSFSDREIHGIASLPAAPR